MSDSYFACYARKYIALTASRRASIVVVESLWIGISLSITSWYRYQLIYQTSSGGNYLGIRPSPRAGTETDIHRTRDWTDMNRRISWYSTSFPRSSSWTMWLRTLGSWYYKSAWTFAASSKCRRSACGSPWSHYYSWWWIKTYNPQWSLLCGG